MSQMVTKKLTVNIDIVSIYSYYLFAELRPLLPTLQACQVHVDFVPVFLGGIFKATKNNAPWINEAKGNYLKDDFRRSAERLGLSVNFPENFLTRANDLVPLQSLHVVKANYSPQVYHAAIGALFTAFWTPPNADINEVDVLKTALLTVEGLDEEKVQYILDAAVMPEFKQVMRQATEAAVKQGAFGVPWVVAQREDKKPECFFGSDRLSHIYRYLGLPFTDITLEAATKL
ncbi:Glutathione S-transferase kappa 1 [Ceratocystis lukuohia]|uniref:Glutathione S-transferase kappa 1 n=1 Tax=Ceratocystis lukuohia TaxID=2019550 RepID=A0ABR4MIM2_9PEZI